MNYSFNKMSQEQAEHIAFNWHYEGKYSFYDFAADKEDLAEFLDPCERENKYFLVKRGKEDIGFFCFEKESESVEMGLGMKPELTGRRMGLDFLNVGLRYAISKYKPKVITLSVATFNERAIKVYKKAGFEPLGTFIQDTNGSHFEFLKMKYECSVADGPLS